MGSITLFSGSFSSGADFASHYQFYFELVIIPCANQQFCLFVFQLFKYSHCHLLNPSLEVMLFSSYNYLWLKSELSYRISGARPHILGSWQTRLGVGVYIRMFVEAGRCERRRGDTEKFKFK